MKFQSSPTHGCHNGKDIIKVKEIFFKGKEYESNMYVHVCKMYKRNTLVRDL